MTIENPLSTTKKAARSIAEGFAARESKEKVEPEHLKEAFAVLRSLYDSNPGFIETYVKLAAEGQDLKEAVGKERLDIYNAALNLRFQAYSDEINIGVEKILEKLSSDSAESVAEELNAFLLSFIEKMDKEVMTEPQIIAAFEGSEDLLRRVAALSKTFLGEMLRNLYKNAFLDYQSLV